MAPRGEITVAVTFGPTTSPGLGRAVAYAAEHADTFVGVGKGTWRATFTLNTEEHRFGRSLRLVEMTYGWRCTEVDVDGSAEWTWAVRLMLGCARSWIRRGGTCREPASGRTVHKCWTCPLNDPDGAPPGARASPQFEHPEPWDLDIPDLLPTEWE
jgi:hypothetical protein